jgi:RHS repeat-associated protein
LRYKAQGATRFTSGSVGTDYRYREASRRERSERRDTGQREEAGIGLYYYRARWYDPVLGRFAQADTIVPGAGNPGAWDRYAYVGTTPSGGLILQAITIVRKGVAGRTTCRHTPELVPAKPTLRPDG